MKSCQNRLIWDSRTLKKSCCQKKPIAECENWKMLKKSGLCLLVLLNTSAVVNAQEAIAEATVVASKEAVAPTETAKAKAMRPLTVATELVGETRITGTLVDSSALQMKTSFGEAQIPLTEIAGVRFAAGDDTSTTVVMLNGDSITGATDTKFITVETEWGTAKINGSSLVSMLFVPGLQWESSNGLNGKRWSLVESKPSSSSQPRSLNQSSAGQNAVNASGLTAGSSNSSPATTGSQSFNPAGTSGALQVGPSINSGASPFR